MRSIKIILFHITKFNNSKALMVRMNLFILLIILLSYTLEARARTNPLPVFNTVLGVGSGQAPALDGFDPLLSIMTATDNLESLYIYPLLYVNRNMQINYSKSIASSISVNKKQTLYIIKLKKNFKWSNGRLVTANNILYCFDEIKELGALFPNQGLAGIPQDIAYLKINNAHEFTIKLRERMNPELFELDGLTLLNPIYSKPYKRKIMEKYSFNIKGFKVSDGPYKLIDYRPGRYVKLERNSNFNLINIGTDPNLLKFSLSYNYLSNTMDALTNKLQIVEVPAVLKSAIKNDKKLAIHVKKYGFTGINYIVINYKNITMKMFENWRLRHELSQLINQKEIIKSVYHGYGYQMHGVISKSQLPLISSYRKKLEEENTNFNINSKEINDKNITNGKSITILCSDDITEKSIAEIVKNNWSKIGIKVNIRVLPTGLLIAKLRTNKWQMAIVSFAFNSIPIMSRLLSKGGRFNVSGYNNVQLNQIFKKIRLSADTQDLSKYLFKMNNFIIKEQPFIILPHQEILIAYQKELQGVKKAFPPQGNFWPQYIQ